MPLNMAESAGIYCFFTTHSLFRLVNCINRIVLLWLRKNYPFTGHLLHNFRWFHEALDSW